LRNMVRYIKVPSLLHLFDVFPMIRLKGL
jgi:hypothetical protein